MIHNIKKLGKFQNRLLQLSYSTTTKCMKQNLRSAGINSSSDSLIPIRLLHHRNSITDTINVTLVRKDYVAVKDTLSIRGMSTTTVSAKLVDNGETNKPQKESKKTDSDEKDDSNIFLDNLGKIFLAVIASIIIALIRSSLGSKNRTKLRDEMEKSSVLDPLEIDDLRFANNEFTPEVFRILMKKVFATFPLGEASYKEFVSVVLHVMRELKGEQFTIEFGHYLDRVMIGYYEKQKKKQGNKEDTSLTEPLNENVSISFLLTMLSLALNGTISDRIQILFDVLAHRSDSKRKNDIEGEPEVTEAAVENMIDYLQLSNQLPFDPQILTADVQYPIQEYKVGIPEELLAFAKKEVSDKGDLILLGKESFECKDFDAILHSTFICAWGECYGRKK